MKLRKILAAVAAAAVTVSAMTVTSFAALLDASLEESGKPSPEVYFVTYDANVDYTKVAKVEAVVTTSDYVNGTIGISANSEWTTPGQLEISGGGTATWTLDKLNGIDADPEGEGVAQVQLWWLNAGSVSIDSVKLLDADGNVLQEAGAASAPAAEEKPAETAAPAEETPAEAAPAETEAPTEAAPAETAPAADNSTQSAATGNAPAAVMISVMAVAGIAAVASKKRK